MKLKYDVSFHSIERVIKRFPLYTQLFLTKKADPWYLVDTSAYADQITEWKTQLKQHSFTDTEVFKQLFNTMLDDALIINGEKCGFTSNELFAFNRDENMFMIFSYRTYNNSYILKTVIDCDYRSIFRDNVWDMRLMRQKITQS